MYIMETGTLSHLPRMTGPSHFQCMARETFRFESRHRHSTSLLKMARTMIVISSFSQPIFRARSTTFGLSSSSFSQGSMW
jgi:hypothetical protein